MTALGIAIGVTSTIAIGYILTLVVVYRRELAPFGGVLAVFSTIGTVWFIARLWGFA